MKFIVSKLGKKAVSVVCALAVLLSVVSVAFGTLATGGSESVAPYTVNVDTAPAIPVFSLTQVDLKTAVEVLFPGDSTATAGSDITWDLVEGGEDTLTLTDGVLTAYKSGTYKILATAGSKSDIIWIVVANASDSAWTIYSIDFDAYSNDYSKLSFNANPYLATPQPVMVGEYQLTASGKTSNVTPITSSNAGVTTNFPNYLIHQNNGNYYFYPYYDGQWTYNGIAFDYNAQTGVGSIPDAIKFPSGWSTYVTEPGVSGIKTLYKVPHVMPYDLSSGLQTDAAINAISAGRKGIMPWGNHYLVDANHLSDLGRVALNTYANVSGGMRGDTKGYFVFNNEITESFSDFKFNVNLDAEISNIHDGKFNNNLGLSSGKMINLFGRMPIDNSGKPTTSNTYAGAIKTYNDSGEAITVSNAIKYQSISLSPYYTGNYGGKPCGAVVARVDYYNTNAQSTYITSYGSDPYSTDDSSLKVTRWDYLKNGMYRSAVNTAASNTGVNVNVSVKYEGTTATVTSTQDATNTEIVFNDVYENKGAIAIGLESICSYGVKCNDAGVPANVGNWINVHQFSIDLVNDITAENNGSEYPVYTELDIFKITADNPALPMYSGTYIKKADIAIQGDDDFMYLASDLKFEIKNLDAQGNELSTEVIGVKDDLASGRIYAYQKGAYKATVKLAATDEVVANIWIAVKDNKGEDWVLYDIDFDAIATENNYTDYTFEESGEILTVESARADEALKYKRYLAGSLKYKGQEVTTSNIPDALKMPNGWSTVIRGAEYGVVTQWHKVPYVMPYSHTGADGVTPNYTRKISTGLMPFDNPCGANGLGLDLSVPVNVNSILSEGNYTRGYFILNNDITKAFSDYKITTDMHTASNNAVHGTFSTTYNTGVVGRLPVDENSIPTDVPYVGFSTSESYSGSSFSDVTYTQSVRTGFTQTMFLFGLRSDNKNPSGVIKSDSNWHKTSRWQAANYIHGVTLKDGSPLVSGTAYSADNVTLDTWQYLKDKNWRGDMQSGVRIVTSVLFKGNTAVVSSPEDATGKTYTFDNVYSTKGAVGVVAPIISSSVSSSTNKTGDQEWISIHHFTLALANSDDEVPAYNKMPMLSEANNTLELTVNEEMATSEIAIVTENAIVLGSEATWNIDGANVTVAGGKIKATKAGYYNGTVTVDGKTLNIVIAVKHVDGQLNKVITDTEKFVYVTKDEALDLSRLSALIGGKYYAIDAMTPAIPQDSGITVSNGILTATNTGYYTVPFTTSNVTINLVLAVKDNGEEYYENDNYKFTMTEDYVGAKNKYSTLWNDNGLVGVDRADANAPYTEVMNIPDRFHNYYVEGDWVNLYSVESSFSSGEFANRVKKITIGRYIETIGAYAFANYKELEVLELPERLKSIGAYAFANTSKLTEVTLPATLSKIDANAFAGSALTDVYVMNPDAVTIGADAFPITAKIHVAAGSAAEASFTAAGYTVVALETNLADSFKSIHDDIVAIEAARETTVDVGTWYECTNTQSKEHKGLEYKRFALNNRDAGVLHVPAEYEWTNDAGVTSTLAMTMPYINAFSRTFERNRIYEIVFPEIGYQFQMGICEQMTNLKKVTLPTGLVALSQYDFYGTAIEEIVIPATVRNMNYEGYVFAECKNLERIILAEDGRNDNFGTNYIANSKVETIDFPVSMEKIHYNAFFNATNLKRLNFYGRETKLYKTSDGKQVPTLTNCSWPSGLTVGVIKGSWMEEYALKWKEEKNLTIVYLDDRLAEVDQNPENYIISKGSGYNYIGDYVGIGGTLIVPSSGNVGTDTMIPVYSVGGSAFKYVKNRVYSLELSEGLISVEEGAFKDMPNLTKVKLPTSLKTIGKEAFANCGISGKLEIPKNVATVSNSAFAGNTGITEVYFYNAATIIGADAVPETATIYGIKDSTAQAYAEKMEMKFVEITAPAKETAADVSDNKNYTFTINADGVITGYERVDASKAYSLKVTFPAEVGGVKVTAIGENVFEEGSESSSVYAVVIPEGVTEIATKAFYNNLKLTHVSLPNSLVKLGESAFEGTMLIGDIVLSKSVSDIGKSAFKGVNTLSSITVENESCIIKSTAFPRGVKTFTLYGYTNSTAANFASRNSITFVALDAPSGGAPGESDPGDDNTGDNGGEDNDANDNDNVNDPIDEPEDIGGENNVVTIIRQSDMTTTIIVVIAMLAMMMLMGGGLILFIIIKGKQMSE